MTDRTAPSAGPFAQESPVSKTDRHAELVALLNKISEESVTTSNVLADMLDLLRERLPGRAEVKVAPFDPDLIARNLDAIKHEAETPMREHGECCEPVGVTQDQRVGTRIVDRDGDVWERREEGWSLWHSSEWGPWRGHGRWPQPPGNGILRPATPADLARVGIEDEPAPADDLPGEPADPGDVTERARQIVTGAMFGLTTPVMVDAIVSDLADAGLLATPERDAAVAARALREAADKVDRDRRIHDASCGESPAQTHEQAGRDHGVTIGLRQAVRHLNERADRIEQGD